MIEITVESVKQGLGALVEQAGEDFVYDTTRTYGECVYVHEGEPDCIVGQFLAAQGVPVERLEEADTGGGTPAHALIWRLCDEGVLTATSGAVDILSKIQYWQDSDTPWGKAVHWGLNGD